MNVYNIVDKNTCVNYNKYFSSTWSLLIKEVVYIIAYIFSH